MDSTILKILENPVSFRDTLYDLPDDLTLMSLAVSNKMMMAHLESIKRCKELCGPTEV